MYLLVDTRQVADVQGHEEHDSKQRSDLLPIGGLDEGVGPQSLLCLQVPEGLLQILILIPQVLRMETEGESRYYRILS